MKTLISKIFIGFLVTAASFASGNARDLKKLKASEWTEEEKEGFYSLFASMPKVWQRENFIGYAGQFPCIAIACMEFLLDLGVGINDRSKRNNWPYMLDTALIVAVKNNQEEVVQFLLSRQADVNVSGLHMNMPLMVAVKENNYNIAKLLLDGGANIDAKNIFGETAMFFASVDNNIPMLNLLRDYAAKKKHSEL